MTTSAHTRPATQTRPAARDNRSFFVEIALQDYNELTRQMAGFDMGERLLFNGLVSRAFEAITQRSADPAGIAELAYVARYKLFELLQCYKELRMVGTRSADAAQ